ncbi:MAG: hypothetical protein SFZ02_06055 [bacterium]|nr:hypothetical protein [bacterium]
MTSKHHPILYFIANATIVFGVILLFMPLLAHLTGAGNRAFSDIIFQTLFISIGTGILCGCGILLHHTRRHLIEINHLNHQLAEKSLMVAMPQPRYTFLRVNGILLTLIGLIYLIFSGIGVGVYINPSTFEYINCYHQLDGAGCEVYFPEPEMVMRWGVISTILLSLFFALFSLSIGQGLGGIYRFKRQLTISLETVDNSFRPIKDGKYAFYDFISDVFKVIGGAILTCGNLTWLTTLPSDNSQPSTLSTYAFSLMLLFLAGFGLVGMGQFLAQTGENRLWVRAKRDIMLKNSS